MRPVLTVLGAIGLAGVAFYFFMHQEWTAGTAFLAGSLALVLPALFGQGLGHWTDADLMIRFVRNPFGTVVDETLDRLGQQDERPSRPSRPVPTDIQMPERFDPDAAIARYLASKNATGGETDAARGVEPPPAPANKSFGRKRA